jgi:uncharacterized protein (TIGR03032 family)
MPMGLTLCGNKLAIGTRLEILEYQDQPEVGRRLAPAGKHDACYLPRTGHFTGDIRVHEVAWADEELWLVNTRFSSLCTRAPDSSFVPRWRPPFVSALSSDDRCHLNGLAVVDGRPRYVTCLGETDTPGGWRANKANGGRLLDVPSGACITHGLSMPHSPRWYGDKLWVLESGNGAIAAVDRPTGK